MNILALSEINIAGSPPRPMNLRIANKNAGTLSPCVISQCTALVEAHVISNMLTLVVFSFIESTCCRAVLIYRGPAKSNPVWENGGSEDTL